MKKVVDLAAGKAQATEAKVEGLEHAIDALAATCTSESRASVEHQSRWQEVYATVDGLPEELKRFQDMSSANRSLEEELESLRPRAGRVESLDGELKEKNAKIKALEGEVEDARVCVESLGTELKTLRPKAGRVDPLEIELEEQKTEFEGLAQVLSKVREQVETLEEEQEVAKGDAQSLGNELQILRGQVQRLQPLEEALVREKNKVTELEKRLDTAESSGQALHKELEAMRSQAKRVQPLEEEMEQARNNLEANGRELEEAKAASEAVGKELTIVRIRAERVPVLEEGLSKAGTAASELTTKLEKVTLEAGRVAGLENEILVLSEAAQVLESSHRDAVTQLKAQLDARVQSASKAKDALLELQRRVDKLGDQEKRVGKAAAEIKTLEEWNEHTTRAMNIVLAANRAPSWPVEYTLFQMISGVRILKSPEWETLAPLDANLAGALDWHWWSAGHESLAQMEPSDEHAMHRLWLAACQGDIPIDLIARLQSIDANLVIGQKQVDGAAQLCMAVATMLVAEVEGNDSLGTAEMLLLVTLRIMELGLRLGLPWAKLVPLWDRFTRRCTTETLKAAGFAVAAISSWLSRVATGQPSNVVPMLLAGSRWAAERGGTRRLTKSTRSYLLLDPAIGHVFEFALDEVYCQHRFSAAGEAFCSVYFTATRMRPQGYVLHRFDLKDDEWAIEWFGASVR